MSLTVKAADAAQLLSLVPRLLGFVPTQSVVLVPLAQGRSLGAMRVDLPPDDLIDTVAASAIGMVCRIADADAVVAVVYTDAAISPRDTPPALPHRALVDAIAARADACGLRMVDALTVARDGWGSHDDPELPAAGRSLDELRVRDADARALDADGQTDEPVGDQASGAALPRVEPAARRAVSQAMRSL
ncbi:MAG TPA: DUF4192 family protein, partial [Microbacterium sp.]|nr:DUF4192 family protein [Microbacterium sp.]